MAFVISCASAVALAIFARRCADAMDETPGLEIVFEA